MSLAVNWSNRQMVYSEGNSFFVSSVASEPVIALDGSTLRGGSRSASRVMHEPVGASAAGRFQDLTM